MNSTPRSIAEARLTPSTCPRCGGGFECGAAAGRCDCFDLQLSDALKAELARRYETCLCISCLRQLAQAGEGGA